MNKLDKTIEVLNDIVTEDDTEEKERLDVISYLESLKPLVPSYFAEWYEKLKFQRMAYVLEIYIDAHNTMPDNVYEWMNSLGRQREKILTDIERFGYRIEREKLYIIKTPTLKQLPQDYYVIEYRRDEGDSYQFTSDRNKATKFTRNESLYVRTRLKIDWTIEEVGVV